MIEIIPLVIFWISLISVLFLSIIVYSKLDIKDEIYNKKIKFITCLCIIFIIIMLIAFVWIVESYKL